MSTARLDLRFVDDEPTFPPRAHVIRKHGGEKEGSALLTCECSCYQEFEIEVNQLIKDLEEIKRKAKKRFSR